MSDFQGMQSPTEPSALRRLSPADYEAVVQQVAADLFLNDERFRKSVVLREVRKVLFGWGAAIGLTSLATVIGLFINARESLTQTVTTELSRAVKEHVNARTELLNESLKSLTSTAVTQIIHVQKEVDAAQTTLDQSQRQLAIANEQSVALQKRIANVSQTLKLVQENVAWLGDSNNSERVAAFIRTFSAEKDFKTVADLLSRMSWIEGMVLKSEAAGRARIIDETYHQMIQAGQDVGRYGKPSPGEFDPSTMPHWEKLKSALKTEPSNQ
jgi:hypothetical protein